MLRPGFAPVIAGSAALALLVAFVPATLRGQEAAPDACTVLEEQRTPGYPPMVFRYSVVRDSGGAVVALISQGLSDRPGRVEFTPFGGGASARIADSGFTLNFTRALSEPNGVVRIEFYYRRTASDAEFPLERHALVLDCPVGSSGQTPRAAAPAGAAASVAAGPPPAPIPPPRGRFGELARDADGRVATSGNWRVRRESDSMTDQPRVFLSTTGETEQGRTNDAPLMTLRCFQGRLEAFIAVGAFIGTGESRATRLRFDRAEPVAQSWSPSTNGTAVFSPDSRSFVDRLARSERLLIEVTAFGGERYRLAFDLVGLPDVLPEIAACRRPAQPAQQPRPQGQR